MFVYCVKKLGLDVNKVNVNGGAIALGHPLDEYDCYALNRLLFVVLTSGTRGSYTVYRCPSDCHWSQRAFTAKRQG